MVGSISLADVQISGSGSWAACGGLWRLGLKVAAWLEEVFLKLVVAIDEGGSKAMLSVVLVEKCRRCLHVDLRKGSVSIQLRTPNVMNLLDRLHKQTHPAYAKSGGTFLIMFRFDSGSGLVCLQYEKNDEEVNSS